MDRSIQFLLGNDVPQSESASIHPVVAPTPESNDDNKIGFTLDVAVRLDRESEEGEKRALVIPIGGPPPPLADSA